MRHVLALAALSLVACSKSSSTEPSAAGGPPTTATAPGVAPSSTIDALPVVAAPAAPSTGTATLVLQNVYASCGSGRGAPVGTDVLVVIRGEDSKSKPKKEFAFCPSHGADGGTQPLRLQTWENCRSFPACDVISADAASPGRVEVQCGKEHVELESDGTRTVLRGSFGVREMAPHPTTVRPVEREVRKALIACVEP